MKKFIISIDAGTTSNRSILFDLNGKPIFSSQKEFTQYFPKNGWVEHDPEEIWKTTVKTLKDIIRISKDFSLESGLLKNKKVKCLIKNIENKGGNASMIMLGNAVFADIPFKGCKKLRIIEKGACLI